MNSSITVLDETARWRARDVTYLGGTWGLLRGRVPEFELADFRVAPGEPSNPFMRSVIRRPVAKTERPMPVGVVSTSYTLAQHRDVAQRCLQGIEDAGIEAKELRCEVGLTELGEWMHLRIYFPDEFSHLPPDGEPLGLRLECFNSVDGSSRLTLLLGWLRLVCLNGLIIGETRAELRDIHNQHMNLDRIPRIITDALQRVEDDEQRLRSWAGTPVSSDQLGLWADEIIPRVWGKKAACRAYHICTSGFDVEYSNPFAPGKPSTKPIERTRRVPGAPEQAESLYDAVQALSWIASGRRQPDEKVAWQVQIPGLVTQLQKLS